MIFIVTLQQYVNIKSHCELEIAEKVSWASRCASFLG